MEDIDEMFNYADQDHDGKISWQEFQTMINPPKPPEPPKPTRADLADKIKDNEKPKVLSATKVEFDNNVASDVVEGYWILE